MSVSFNYMNWKAPNDYQGNPTYFASSVGQNGSYGTHERFIVAHWNSVLSSTTVNDFRFQYSRDFEFYSANQSGPSVSLGSSSSGGIFSYGMPNALPRPAFPDEHRLEFADSVSMVHGKHTFKFGVDISPIHELLINLFQGGGIYSYSYNASNPAFTFQSWAADLYDLPLASDGPNATARIGKHYNTFAQAYDPITGEGKDDFYDVDYGCLWRGYLEGAFEPDLQPRASLRYPVGSPAAPAEYVIDSGVLRHQRPATSTRQISGRGSGSPGKLPRTWLCGEATASSTARRPTAPSTIRAWKMAYTSRLTTATPITHPTTRS